jgi:DNA-directed RNA polymerase alpha subunit
VSGSEKRNYQPEDRSGQTTKKEHAFQGEGEMNNQLMDPTPELPDDTPIANVRFNTRIRNVLAVAGLTTVGEVRETADETLLSFQDFGPDSVGQLRKSLGPPSCDGERPS